MLCLLRCIVVFMGCWIGAENLVCAGFPKEKDFDTLNRHISYVQDDHIKSLLESKFADFKSAYHNSKQEKRPLKKLSFQKATWNAFVSLYAGSLGSKTIVELLHKWNSFIFDTIATPVFNLQPAQQYGVLSNSEQQGLLFLKENDKLTILRPYLKQEQFTLFPYPLSVIAHPISHHFLMRDGELITQAGVYMALTADKMILGLYPGDKGSSPFTHLLHVFSLDAERLHTQTAVFFLPLLDTHQEFVSSTQEGHIPPELGAQLFMESRSFPDFLEKLIQVWLGISDQEIGEQRQEQEEPVPSTASLLESTREKGRKQTQKNRKEESITPYGQPTWTRPQNLPPLGGLSEHLKAFFAKHPYLRDLQIKRINTKGSHTVTHFEKGSPKTYVKPHGPSQHKK